MSTTRADRDWARILEHLLYLVPPVAGVGIVGVLQDLEVGVPGLDQVLFLLGTAGYTVLTIGITVAIVCDASRVRRRPKASGNWRPRPWLNGLFALVWAPVAGVAYLARRHRYFGTPPGWSGWWLLVLGSLVAMLLGAAVAAIAYVLAIPGLITAAIGLASTVVVGSFPVAIHRDAAYVCTQPNSWRPNPGVYLGLAFLSLPVAPLQPLLAGYYLYKRRAVVDK